MAGVCLQVRRCGEDVVGEMGCEEYILESDVAKTAVLAAERHNDLALARGSDGLSVGHPHNAFAWAAKRKRQTVASSVRAHSAAMLPSPQDTQDVLGYEQRCC
jgi:hypothetical protein